MKRWYFVVLLALMPNVAWAGGINLSWNDCGTNGTDLATFFCNSNTGFNTLVASFVAPVPMTQLTGVEVSIEVVAHSQTLPSWWDFSTPSGCRVSRFTGSVDFTSGPTSCVDFWQGQGVEGTVFVAGYQQPNRIRIRAVGAVPTSAAASIDDVTEYYALKFNLSHAKTVGTGSCAGCDVGACLFLDYVNLYQPAGVGDYTEAQQLNNQIAGWQCPSYPITEGGLCITLCPVPARSKTWGGIKSLYR